MTVENFKIFLLIIEFLLIIKQFNLVLKNINIRKEIIEDSDKDMEFLDSCLLLSSDTPVEELNKKREEIEGRAISLDEKIEYSELLTKRINFVTMLVILLVALVLLS